jgi:peptidoglycan/LPS O-acetylase OafA/YrhL
LLSCIKYTLYKVIKKHMVYYFVMDSKNTDTKEYFPLIDIARFLAAVSVLCFHYFSTTGKILEPGFIRTYLENGFFGVQLFFMISGFVIYYSLQNGIQRYVIGRFLRIYPLFWVCCTITYLVTIFFGDSHLPVTTYLYNLLIVNDGKTAFMIDGSYWTLTHELFFYVYIGLFVYFFGKKHIEYFFYIWLAVLSSAIFFELHTLLIFKVLLVRSGFYFIFGGLLALLWHTRRSASLVQIIRRSIGLLLAASMPVYLSLVLQKNTGAITNHFGMYDGIQYYIVLGLFVLTICLVIFSSYVRNSTILRAAVVLGGITYPVYLLHQVIGATLLGDIYGVYSLASAASAILICVISYLLYRYDLDIRKYLFRRISIIITKK